MRSIAVVLLLLASAAVARAERPSLLPERLSAAPCMPAVSNGADFGCALDGSGRPRLEPSALWPAPETYFAHHSARVEHDMLIFTGGYTLEHMRARDTLLLYGGPAGGARASLLGFGLFSAAIVASAHVPNPVRLLFDGDLHFGPAVFDSGVGAGFGGKL